MSQYTLIDNKTFRDHHSRVSFFVNLYYPVGLSKDQEDYHKYMGIKSVSRIIERNIVDEKTFKSKWTDQFIDELSRKLGQNVLGATAGMVPNIGGLIILEESEDLRYSKSIQFYVSLLAPYYSIQIVAFDKFMKSKHKYLPGTTIGNGVTQVVVSPVLGHYKDLFLAIEDFIIKEIEDAKFLPFYFDMIRIKGFEVLYKEGKDCPVSDAFFHKLFILHEDTKIIGDIHYKAGSLQYKPQI